MSAVQEQMVDIIQRQPADATYEEILRALAFERMIFAGLENSRKEQTISNDEMQHRIYAWRK